MVTGSKPSAVDPTRKASGASRPRRRSATTTAQPRQRVAGAHQANRGLPREMVGHLAHQHNVHRSLLEWRHAGTGDRARHAGARRQGRRRPAQLQAQRPQHVSPAAGPADGAAREIARAGAQVEQRERLATGQVAQQPFQAVPHGGGPAEPAVGTRHVAERARHRRGIGGRVVQQLGAEGGDAKVSRHHPSAP